MVYLAVIIGLIPAYIASKKGKNFLLWWLYGFALFIIALPHALIMDEDIEKSKEYKKCPYCAEMIKKEAIVCKHCQRDLKKDKNKKKKEKDTNKTEQKEDKKNNSEDKKPARHYKKDKVNKRINDHIDEL